MPDELQDIKEARIIRISPGDKIILRHPDRLSFQAIENLTTIAEKVFGCPVLVLSEGMDIDVLRKEG